MRLDRPRIEPLATDEIDPEIRDRFGDGEIYNIFRTLAVHPKLLKRWLVFGNHVLAKSSLPPRDRELLILRVGWLCGAEYEWGQHVLIARGTGLADAEIEAVATGPRAESWSAFDRALLQAADELHADAFISDATWKALANRYDETQLLDLVFTVGQYHTVSMALNSLGVQPDPGLPRFPPEHPSGGAS